MQPLVTALGPVVFLCLLRPPAAYLLPLSISRAGRSPASLSTVGSLTVWGSVGALKLSVMCSDRNDVMKSEGL